ncbi:hypothetical protein [Bradyrhizobium sp. STM 3561]|uniref:hypothetical protein n=1 Tax=Bradyrhizobium sp. STM 3561 TaxID=578923 RepID=UPI0038909489
MPGQGLRRFQDHRDPISELLNIDSQDHRDPISELLNIDSNDDAERVGRRYDSGTKTTSFLAE